MIKAQKWQSPISRKNSQFFFISNFIRKNEVFSTFLKNYSNDFDNFWSECRGERYRPAEKNRTSKAYSVLEIFIHKVGIFGQNGQTEVQRSYNNSRTVNATKNLIQYSESAENSLSQVSHQILPNSTSLGSNFTLKMAYFDPKIAFFRRFSRFPD